MDNSGKRMEQKWILTDNDYSSNWILGIQISMFLECHKQFCHPKFVYSGNWILSEYSKL